MTNPVTSTQQQSRMKFCVEWLKGFVKEAPIEFIAAPEPYWLPEKPVR